MIWKIAECIAVFAECFMVTRLGGYMNKYFIIFTALLSIFTLISCSKNETLYEPNEIQIYSETSDVTESTILTTTLTTVSSEVTTVTITQVLDFSKYENMSYENNYNYHNFIYFTESLCS